jgi:hypothetical protein
MKVFEADRPNNSLFFTTLFYFFLYLAVIYIFGPIYTFVVVNIMHNKLESYVNIN